MDFISTAQAAMKWGISERRVQKLCEQGRIDGAFRFSRVWAIPKDAIKPIDPRKKITGIAQKNAVHDNFMTSTVNNGKQVD